MNQFLTSSFKRRAIALVAISPFFLGGCLNTQSNSPAEPTTSKQSSAANRSTPLIDNLEDGDRFNQWGGTWFTYDDRNQGGDSKVVPEGYSAFRPQPGGAENSSLAARMTGTVTTTYENSFIGMGTDLNNPNNPVDIRGYNGIEFWAKGDGKTYRFKLRSPATADYDDYGYNIAPTPQWKRYEISFEQLEQEGWGQPAEREAALSEIISITWQTLDRPHDSIELAIDNIKFIDSQSTP
ncbi:CIA30 family protein [Lusitaniella coriacea]|uniref:CIA30 family protein n=1 Tax=Lusitaniella coriacea TaxID=1983105 RepID=UPI003CE96533